MKRAVKYIMMISGIVSLSLSCLFSISVYADELTYVDMSYTKQTYSTLFQYDMEYYATGYSGSYSGTTEQEVVINNSANDFIRAYIRNGRWGEDSIDEAYPIFIGVSTRDDYTSLSFPMSNYCIALDELTVINGSGISNYQEFINILPDFLNAQDSGVYIANTMVNVFHWRTLYSMGYLIDNMGSFALANGNTGYLYVMRKFKADDQITFMGALDIDGTESGSQSGTVGHQIDEANVYMNFDRYDFAPTYITLHGTNDPYRMGSNDYAQIMVQEPNNYYIYDTNCSITAVSGSNPVTYYLNFDSSIKNPYIIFANVNTTAVSTNRIVNTMSFNMLTIDGEMDDYSSMLTSINDNLVTIQDLLSDLQVTEINNIYEDITNNYDIDIDLELNTLITDLTDDLNDIDTTDPNYQIPTNDLEKITSFRLIFTNLINTMNSAGIGLLYFVPLILLIIGAII